MSSDEELPDEDGQTRRERATARARELADRARDKAVDLKETHSSISLSTEMWERFKDVEGNEAVLILTLLFCVAVLPAAIVMFAWSAWFTGSSTSFGDSLAQVWHLRPAPAEEISAAFTTNRSSLASAASVGVITFAMVGVGYATTLEKVYRIAWRLPQIKSSVGAYLTRLGVFTLMFVQIGVMHVASSAIRNLHQPFRSALLLAIAAPLVAVAWSIVARVFLRGGWPGYRAVLPGVAAGIATIVALDFVGGLLLGNWITSYTDFFGTSGIMIALLFWYWIVAYVWVLMPVFSAVLYERRGGSLDQAGVETAVDRD